ncbi:ORF6N domain-containing protein [candidate division KSB1 bacterium]|nr:ORF6N domain-containing protein [candidate division KSB1 bacterium]
MMDIIPIQKIERKILFIRDQQVMLDRDLAELYGVETKVLNQAVKRNITRFPEDFMFQLTKEEKDEVVTKCDHLASLKFSYRLPFAFNLYGVSMLSSVLNSPTAIRINIQIIRAFINYVMQVSTYEELRKAMHRLELKHENDIEYLSKLLFHEVSRLEELLSKPKKAIGFKP